MKTLAVPSLLASLACTASLGACSQQTGSDIIDEQAEATSDHADLAERRAAGAQTEEEAQVFEEHSDRLDARARELEKEADRLVE
ncbi:hypothetical protein [Erythrobacter sp.]|uniref:hypothetical protein n=1 Tax=Erythrobacter sp. TaxID=1042 RepID=UPI001425D873|nr:hypothetical protein [Erythrobacter sp.]QIQ87761.1 MAG: hypothetical protein G9473_14500 [Erythrobacter sp.]